MPQTIKYEIQVQGVQFLFFFFFSYFLSVFLFSPIFKLKPPIFPIFLLVEPKFATKLKMEL